MPTFCVADFIFIFSMGASLCWLQIYYLCFPGVIPHHCLSQTAPFHIILFCHYSQPASKATEDGELSMLFIHPRHEKSFPTVFTFCNGKSREESRSVRSQARSSRGGFTMKLPASGKEGKECRAHLKYRSTYVRTHT